MKRATLLLLACVAGAVLCAETTRPLPTPFPFGRYQELSTRSPFSVASAVSPTPAATPGFAAQLYVNGIAHLGKADFVAIKSRDPDKPNAMFIEVGGTASDGMKVNSVQWSPEMAKSTATVEKDGERATLVFDEAQLAKNAAQPGQPGQLAPPGVRMPTLPGQMRPMLPGQGIPVPGQPPQMPRIFPGNGVPTLPEAVQLRRRRIIQSGQ